MFSGYLHREGSGTIYYRFNWTIGKIAEHGVTIEVIFGQWDNQKPRGDGYGIVIYYREDDEVCGFMIGNADDTSLAKHPLVGHAVRREEIAGTPVAKELFEAIDYIWLHDDRLKDIAKSS